MNQPDWEIGKLYNQAWKIVKENRVLWLFGMLVGGFSFNVNGGTGSSPDGLEKLFEKSPSPAIVGPEQISQVLGTQATLEPIGQLFSAIPASFYIILVVEILSLIVACVVVGLISSAWAHASLLHGIQAAAFGQKATIADSSQKAFSNIKPLIWLSIMPILVIAGLIFISVLLVILTLAIDVGLLRVLFLLLGGLSVGAVLYAMIFLAIATIWAPRIVVYENKSAKASLVAGYKIAKKKFWPTVLLGLVNTILSGFVIAVPLLLLVGIFAFGIFAIGENQILGMSLFGLGTVLIIVFIFGFILVSGILHAFKATVWTIAYNAIKGKYV